MSTLKDRLSTDLTAAIKGRQEVRTATLRMALAAVHTEEVAGKSARELSDDEVLTVLAREAKKRTEAAEAFDKGGRPELAARERAEGDVLATYLPAQLSDEELTEIVRTAIAETGATEVRQLGQVMKAVLPEVGKRADGGRVSAEVRRQLS
ncbi:MAG: GatB/YqeY domain-containing protein [Mycobacteriales bacterium]